MLKYLIGFSVLISAITTSSFAQVAHGSDIINNTDFYRKDFVVFRDSMEKIHPALYRYRNENEINRLFDSCYEAINNDMALLEFYMLVRFMAATIEDGHLACSPPRELIQSHLGSAKIFPLRLWFADERAFVLCDNDGQFKDGEEIISIDDIPVREILATLFKYMLADGDIHSSKYWKLNGNEPNFPFMYSWLYGERSEFRIKYLSKAGIIQDAGIQAAIFQKGNCYPDLKTPEEYLSLDFKPNNTALLRIQSFDINKFNDDESFYGRFLDSAFTEIKFKKIKNLIIDLRNNGGGEDSYGALLYSYLANKPFDYYTSIETKTSVFSKKDHPNLALQQPKENRFNGKCYFLINGKSFSTTSEFCAIAKSNNRGKFIGEETGGGYYGNTGGDQVRFALPYSKINIYIPKRKYVLAVRKSKYSNRGVLPNYPVMPTIKDILQDIDTQLNFAYKMATGY